MYSVETFKTMYIDYTFDNPLLDQNNTLINSNQFYLDIKNNYLKQTQINFNKFKELHNDYTILNNNHTIKCIDNLTTHYYKFINTDNLQNTLYQLKVLLKEQKYLFDNFINYIAFISSS